MSSQQFRSSVFPSGPMGHYSWLPSTSVNRETKRIEPKLCLSERTFAHFDLDSGIALGDILDASHYFRHLGGIGDCLRCVEGRDG
jgi:hypothetical protein